MYLAQLYLYSRYSSSLLDKHKDSLTELIRRDKNRPSVVAWSISNEPRTQVAASDNYFGYEIYSIYYNNLKLIYIFKYRQVAGHVRKLDKSRPITIALARGYFEDRAVSTIFKSTTNVNYFLLYLQGQHLDIISFNRYNGWYSNAGRVDMITQRVVQEAEAWYKKYNKPVLMSEYGADTYEGLHIVSE